MPPNVLAQLEASADLDGVVVGRSTQPTLVVVLASWCPHCKAELAELEPLRSRVRVLGVNYRGHEDYAGRGGPAAVRAFARRTPWLRIVPIDDALFAALGSPPQIPTIFVFDRSGALVASYSRKLRPPPDRAELAAVISKL
jgi:thiol-disulfide isomerase/thioredoxin